MKKIFFVIAALILTGCSGIPSSGSIKYGPEINTIESDQFIQVIGRPPTPGMTPEQIVQGFLTAMADSRDDYAIAKQYLTTGAARSWKSSAGITIYDQNNFQVSLEDTVATLSAAKLGEINSTGYLSVAGAGATLNSQLRIAQDIQGEWRIAELADGVLLTINDIDRSFKGYPIYFFGPDRKTLVADTVLLPQTLTGSATALVQALLAGPSNKLETAIFNSFPTGTTLTYGSVPVTEGVANIDLTNQILSADQQTRSLMSAQLTWTLSTLPNVNSISITVSGQPITVAGVSSAQSVRDWAQFNPVQFTGNEILHYVRDNQVFSLNLNGEETLVVQVNPASRVNISEVFGAPQGGSVAAVTTDSKRVLVSTGRGGQFEQVASGEAISKPSWDQSGGVFYSDYGVGIYEVDSTRAVRPVSFEINELASISQVKQIAVAKDGVRVAMVVSDGSIDLLVGGAIVKTSNSTTIVGLHLIERNITAIKDLAWQTPTSIAVLGSDPAGGNLIMDVDIATGTHTSTVAPVSAQSLASSIGKQVYVGTVIDSKAVISRQVGSNWTDVVSGYSPYFSE